MAIGTLTMILTNVGLSLFNNWQGSKQNAELQRKKEEFDRAAMENQRERMWKLMREGQELTLQLEKERHQQRLDDLKSDFDNLVKRLAYDATISHWPLKVLPMVMKNQALGNLLAKQEEDVALHCILTPSNSLPFNRTVLPVVERELESFCNQHWSTMTTHPILFYSGAWNGVNDPTGTQVESLKSALGNLPTLLITPYFPNEDKLIFQINIWGVGASATDKYENAQVIEPNDFQRDYIFGAKYEEDVELVDNAIEDIIPYLQCLIGYFADTYFWSAFGHAPQLPTLIVNGTINTDGMPHLIKDSREYYDNLLTASEKKSLEKPFAEDNLLNLYDGVSALWDKKKKSEQLETIFDSYFTKRIGKHHHTINGSNFDVYTIYDLPFLKSFISEYIKTDHSYSVHELTEAIKIIDGINDDYEILNSTDLQSLSNLAKSSDLAKYRLGEIYEFSIGVKYNSELSESYYSSIDNPDNILVSFLLSARLGKGQLKFEYKIHGLDVSIEEVLRYLSNSGVVQASLALAQHDMANTHTTYQEARYILESLETNHPLKYYLLDYVYEHTGNNGIIEHTDLLQKAADLGYIKAQELLCQEYKKGEKRKENPLLHAHYAELGMLQKSPECTYALAMCYFKGYGVEKSNKVALLLFDKAVEYGSKDAIRIKSIINQI